MNTIKLTDFVATANTTANSMLCLFPAGLPVKVLVRSDSIRIDVDIDGTHRAVGLIVDTTIKPTGFVARATVVTAGLHMEDEALDAMVDSVIALRTIAKVLMATFKDLTITV